MLLNLHIIGQKIYCDEAPFLATESKNYLECKFEFSEDWEGCIKTAIFRGVTGVPYCIEIEDDTCTVPYEVLTGNVFLISVFGILDDKRITTNTVDIYVKDSGYAEGETPPAPTPTMNEKMLKELHTINTIQQEELAKKADKATTLAGYGITDAYTKEDVDRMEASVYSVFGGRTDLMEMAIDTHTAQINQLGESLDFHAASDEIHVLADERALWNTVSDKANQADVDTLQSQMGDVSDLPNITGGLADNLTTAVSENWSLANTAIAMIGDMSNLPCDTSGTVISNMEAINTKVEGVVLPELSTHSADIGHLQTQIGDIATILADIKADQEALINGGDE